MSDDQAKEGLKNHRPRKATGIIESGPMQNKRIPGQIHYPDRLANVIVLRSTKHGSAIRAFPPHASFLESSGRSTITKRP
jgi:hypothetical protein